MKYLAFILFLLLCSHAQAEIRIHYESNPGLAISSLIEDAVKRSAQLFKNDSSFADLGPYDFQSEGVHDFYVMDDSGEQVENWSGTVFIPVSLIRDYHVFVMAVVHELSHSYDYEMTNKLKAEIYDKAKKEVKKAASKGDKHRIVQVAMQRFNQIHDKYKNTHKRSQQKEETYLEGIRGSISKSEHERLKYSLEQRIKYSYPISQSVSGP